MLGLLLAQLCQASHRTQALQARRARDAREEVGGGPVEGVDRKRTDCRGHTRYGIAISCKCTQGGESLEFGSGMLLRIAVQFVGEGRRVPTPRRKAFDGACHARAVEKRHAGRNVRRGSEPREAFRRLLWRKRSSGPHQAMFDCSRAQRSWSGREVHFSPAECSCLLTITALLQSTTCLQATSARCAYPHFVLFFLHRSARECLACGGRSERVDERAYDGHANGRRPTCARVGSRCPVWSEPIHCLVPCPCPLSLERAAPSFRTRVTQVVQTYWGTLPRERKQCLESICKILHKTKNFVPIFTKISTASCCTLSLWPSTTLHSRSGLVWSPQ